MIFLPTGYGFVIDSAGTPAVDSSGAYVIAQGPLMPIVLPSRPNDGRILYPTASYYSQLTTPSLDSPVNTKIYPNQSCSMLLPIEDNFSSQFLVDTFTYQTTVLNFTKPDSSGYSVTSTWLTPLLYIGTIRGRDYLVYNFAGGELDQVGLWTVVYNTGTLYISGPFVFNIYPT